MNIRKLLFLPILFIFVLATAAQEKTGSLLWKISGNGLERPSYILGTHHLFPTSFLDSIPGVFEAFATSEQMVGELIMNDMAAMASEMQAAGMMPRDTTWQMLLSEEDYRFVDEKLTAFLGIGMQAIGMFKPTMVNMTFTLVFYQRTFPQTNPNESMDLWFQQQATSRNIPVLGLEDVQDQMAAITVGSLKSQAADLVCSLRNLDYLEASIRRLNYMYRTADLTGLFGMLSEASPCPISVEQEIVLNNTRNERWLEKLPAIMASKPSFIAVGALHLPGEPGLLSGLARAGYTVEPVK